MDMRLRQQLAAARPHVTDVAARNRIDAALSHQAQ